MKLTLFLKLFICLLLLSLAVVLMLFPRQSMTFLNKQTPPEAISWPIQSIDTMKESRDLASSKLNDPNYSVEIDTQVRNIKETGANYIAIATPYDDRFLPFLVQWVSAARKYNLKIWYRGNWSAWEGWFNVPKGLTFEKHIQKSVQFIKDNPDLFRDGDSFTACPECENGAAGDPRQTGKVQEYRAFLVEETAQTSRAFQSMNKKVSTNWLSMNKDVADLVMDKQTVQKTGGLIVIDHYVKTPKQLARDVDSLAKKTGAKIMLGEIGAPIPDIHGQMTQAEQAKWTEESLDGLLSSSSLIGINYWLNRGGSTALWTDGNQPKLIVNVLSRYYQPVVVTGSAVDQLGETVKDFTVSTGTHSIQATDGQFFLRVVNPTKLMITKDGYRSVSYQVDLEPKEQEAIFTLERAQPDWLFSLRLEIKKLLSKIRK